MILQNHMIFPLTGGLWELSAIECLFVCFLVKCIIFHIGSFLRTKRETIIIYNAVIGGTISFLIQWNLFVLTVSCCFIINPQHACARGL